MEQYKYRYLHIARVVVEAATPLAVGCGGTNILTDSPVARDCNGLPYLPATSLAGVIRHAIGKNDKRWYSIFGYQESNGGSGSRLMFTDGVLVGREGKALDGLQAIDWNDDFYAAFRDLSIRDHVRIDHRGVSADAGKFDEEVVYKGCRFVFEMTLVSDDAQDGQYFGQVLQTLSDVTFRVGSGTRRGRGHLTVKDSQEVSLDLHCVDDLEAYIGKSANLAQEWSHFAPRKHDSPTASDAWVNYTLQLEPLDFFLFGSGKGDDEADKTSLADKAIVWTDGHPSLTDHKMLIPATSVKGAIAHRTAYHYNRRKGLFVGKINDEERRHNKAVESIFGHAGIDKNGRATRGNLMIDDVYTDIKSDDTMLSYHIKNDYFTGGVIDGALFQEKSANGRGRHIDIAILVARAALADDEVCQAFEQSLRDVCQGLLPLGGASGRGNGMFTGKLLKEGKEI